MRKIWSSSMILRICSSSVLGGFQVGTERLLDDDAAELILALLGQARLAEAFDDGAEELRGRREVEHHVLVALALQQVVDLVAQIEEHAVRGDVAREMMEAFVQPVRRRAIDLVSAFAVASLDDVGHRLQEVRAERLLVRLAAIDAEDLKVVVQQAFVDEIVDRRHQQALRQVARRAEDHEDARRRDRGPARCRRGGLKRHLVHDVSARWTASHRCRRAAIYSSPPFGERLGVRVHAVLRRSRSSLNPHP